MIDLTEMVVFSRVVDRGSFTAAARELRVPPSTLSRKVAALEKRLGVRLLERTTRRLKLTDAGTQYHQRCARIAREAEEADAEMASLSRSPRGILRISAPPAWGELFLHAPIAEYARRHGEVQVELVLSDVTVDLLTERFDLALRLTQRLDDSSLVVRRLGVSTPMLCASPEYLRAHGTPRTLSELGQHSIVSMGRGPVVWRYLDETGAPVDLPISARAKVNNAKVAHELCLAGLGISLLPSFLAARSVEEGTLVELLKEVRWPPRDLCLLLPSTRQLSAKVRSFLEVLDSHFARKRPWS